MAENHRGTLAEKRIDRLEKAFQTVSDLISQPAHADAEMIVRITVRNGGICNVIAEVTSKHNI